MVFTSWFTTTAGDTYAPLTVSLITCYPGAEVYALCGHSAIRIRSTEMDSVWNYGLFDFSQPNFLYRFVKGETDYRMGGYPFTWFMPEYVERGSKVVEQKLNLTEKQARKLLAMLHEEEKPQNSTYRYNYVRDNCGTRILARLDSVVGYEIQYPGETTYGSFRREMQHYHANYPWYQFGIDLVLGSGLDKKTTVRQEMFVPIEIMKRVEKARFNNGQPMVLETQELYPGHDNAVLSATPWWQTPLFISWLFFALCAIVILINIRRCNISRWLFSLYYILVGIAGIVVWYLVFFSSHEATSPNYLMWWLNPIMLICGITIWFQRMRKVSTILIWLEMIVAFFLLLSWPFQKQSGNAAIFPLMLIALMLGTGYAIISNKTSYNTRKSRPQRVFSAKKTRRKTK